MRRILTGLVISLALAAGVVAFAQNQPNQPSPPAHPAHNRDAKLLLTYSRSAGNAEIEPNQMPGVVFALWDDGWALGRLHLRDDHGPFVAMRFSSDTTARMKAAIDRSGADAIANEARGIAPDAAHADLTVRTAKGVRSYMWSEHLSAAPPDPGERTFASMWIACTSIVVSETPEEVLDEKTFLKGGVFRGHNLNNPIVWPDQDGK